MPSSKPSTSSFQRVPQETLTVIFSLLDHREIIALQKCCRGFRHTVQSSAGLKYIVALAAAGVLNHEGLRGSLTSAEMLERLGAYEQAWLNMRWSDHVVVKARRGERISAPSNPVILQSESQGRSYLRVFLAPSRLRAAGQHEWEIGTGSQSIFTYIFDNAHDLVVIQTSEVPRPRFHFLTLSTGDPHPETRLQHLLESDHALFGVLLTRHYLVLPTGPGRQTVVDWQTGRNVTHVMCNYYSLGFLDDRHLIVLPSPQQESGPCALVYRLRPEPVAVVLAFGLPSFSAGHPMADCTIKCAPYDSYTAPNLLREGCFSVDPHERLLTIGFSEFNGTPSFELVVHARSLLAYLPAVPPAHAPVFIPWADWGITRTHISLAIPPPRVGWRDYCIFGSRRITIRPRRRLADDCLVADIYDYNSRRIARMGLVQESVSAAHRSWEIRYSDTVDSIWTGNGPLITRLPHIKTEMPLPQELQKCRPEEVSLFINDNGAVACTASSSQYNDASPLKLEGPSIRRIESTVRLLWHIY